MLETPGTLVQKAKFSIGSIGVCSYLFIFIFMFIAAACGETSDLGDTNHPSQHLGRSQETDALGNDSEDPVCKSGVDGYIYPLDDGRFAVEYAGEAGAPTGAGSCCYASPEEAHAAWPAETLIEVDRLPVTCATVDGTGDLGAPCLGSWDCRPELSCIASHDGSRCRETDALGNDSEGPACKSGVDGYIYPTGDGRYGLSFAAHDGRPTNSVYCCENTVEGVRAAYPDLVLVVPDHWPLTCSSPDPVCTSGADGYIYPLDDGRFAVEYAGEEGAPTGAGSCCYASPEEAHAAWPAETLIEVDRLPVTCATVDGTGDLGAPCLGSWDCRPELACIASHDGSRCRYAGR
ncbi:MAG: hypothetical protein IPK13_25035 [Deltaproteobacteria bacterium]|nr:hypothetical protein [Deltaproteobacteria bacterium]